MKTMTTLKYGSLAVGVMAGFFAGNAPAMAATYGDVSTSTTTVGATTTVNAGTATVVATAGGAATSVTVGNATTPSTTVAIPATATVVVPAGSTLTVNGTVGGAVNAGGGTVNLNTGGNANVVTGRINLGATDTSTVVGGVTQTVTTGGTVNLQSATTITGVLTGTGNITGSTLTIGSGGTFSPGNSPGAVSSAANLVLGPGAVGAPAKASFELDGTTAATAAASGAGTYDQVTLTGTAGLTINASTQLVVGVRDSISGAAAGTYTRVPTIGNRYDIIVVTGTGTVTGNFTSVTNNDVDGNTGLASTAATNTTNTLALNSARFDVGYTNNRVSVYVTPASYANTGATANQKAVGAQVDAVRTARGQANEWTSNNDSQRTWNAVFSENPAGIREALDQVSGATLAGAANAAVSTGSLINTSLLNRASHNRVLAQSGLKDGSNGMSGGDAGHGWAAWVQPVGKISTVDRDNNGFGFDSNSYGVLTGLEARRNSWVIGASFGYVRDNIDYSNIGRAGTDTTKVDNYSFNGYVGYEGNPVFANGAIGYTWKSFENKRNLAFGQGVDALSRVATSKPDGGAFSVAAEVGYTFKPMGGFIVEPSFGLQYIGFSRDGFTETGAGTLNLRADKQSFDSVQSTLGVRLAKPIKTDSGVVVVPELRAAWQHELADTKANVTAAFTGFANNKWTVSGVDVGSDRGVIGAGIKAQLSNSFDLFADYSSSFSSNTIDHNLSAGLKVKF